MEPSDLYAYINLKDIDEALFCKFCKRPFNDPVVTQCGETYCRRCVRRHFDGGSQCQSELCKQQSTQSNLITNRPPNAIISMLDRLMVRCLLCGKLYIKRGVFEQHIKESCRKAPVYCHRNDIECRCNGARDELSRHVQRVHSKESLPVTEHMNTLIINSQNEPTRKLEEQTPQFKRSFSEQKIELNRKLNELISQMEILKSENWNQNDNSMSVQNCFRTLQSEIERLKVILRSYSIPNISPNAQWLQNGVTLTGSNTAGDGLNQLCYPYAIAVDDDQSVIVVDRVNNRIMRYTNNYPCGRVIAGGNGLGDQLNQLHYPTDVLIDRDTGSLIIADRHNKRVVRWCFHNNRTEVLILIENIWCFGLAMDDNRFLYVSDTGKHEVRRYHLENKNGILVAGGNGKGSRLDQLEFPGYIFVDQRQNVYVSDWHNHRVMKWEKGANIGIVVAGGREGYCSKQLSYPSGLFVDTSGTLFVADHGNHRVMCWPRDAREGTVIVGGYGRGERSNQFNCVTGLSFDQHGNLYVADYNNHRVQKFSII